MRILLILPILALVACEATTHHKKPRDAAFWQRDDATSALFLRGPKAQHQLHKDISSCVSEVKELSRLGTIRDANPPSGIELNVGLARKWQSPRGDGPLNAEYRDFHDFESCMTFKGWKRTEYVRPEVIEHSNTNYDTVILGRPYGREEREAVESFNPDYKVNE